MDRGGHGGAALSGGSELKQRHLGGGILHGHAVGTEEIVALATGRQPRILGMAVSPEDLLGQGDGAPQGAARLLGCLGQLGIEFLGDLDDGILAHRFYPSSRKEVL